MMTGNLFSRSVSEWASPIVRRVAAASLVVAAAWATPACTVSSNSPPDECSTSSDVSCATGTGWTCTGSAQPEDANSDLVCSTDGVGDFCCISGGMCNYDANVTGCEPGTVGYSCASGSPPPDSADPTLVCSVPATVGGLDTYCCFTNTTAPPSGSTCEQDPSVTGCQPDNAGNPSYGFSCTGSENPDTDFSNITCSTTGTQGMDAQGNAATLYCCTFN